MLVQGLTSPAYWSVVPTGLGLLLIKKIAFIKFYAVGFQEAFVFIWYGFFVVMLFLSFDVTYGLFQQRRTDAERAIAFLPNEVLIVAVNSFYPFATVGLDFLDEFGHTHGFWHGGQDVDVVLYAANGNRVSPYVINNASDIGENLRQVFFPYTDARAFHMEDDVDVEFCVSVCHICLFLVQGLTSPAYC